MNSETESIKADIKNLNSRLNNCIYFFGAIQIIISITIVFLLILKK